MNPDFGTNAQAYDLKRVKYEGTNTIRMGMAVCYNNDTTTNLLGYDKGNSRKGTTTAEGYQNEGKFKLVEEPSAGNAAFFAGVVVDSKDLNNAGSGASWLDIARPNGAILPVWTDKSVVIGEPAYLEIGENTIVNIPLGPQVGIFTETIDRSTVAGLALCKIFDPASKALVMAEATAGAGPSKAIWADCPWDAIKNDPSLGQVYFEDFLGSQNLVTAEGWVITQVTTGTLSTPTSLEGGVLVADSAGNTTADNGVNVQLVNNVWKTAAGRKIWFEARVKMNDATDQYFVGLAAPGTTAIIASGALQDTADKVGFFHHAASTNDKISTVAARTSADDATADVADNTDGTYMTVGFVLDGLTSVKFYVNGTLVETGTTVANLPNAAMCLSLVAQIEVSGADAELSVDWVKIAQYGRS